MSRILALAVVGACTALVASPTVQADRDEPPPLYGYYDLFVDFTQQTFNGMPTPMPQRTFPTRFTTQCAVDGCVARMDNADDHARNPGAPVEYEYRWRVDRWETSGPYPFFCDRNDPNSAVRSQRSDFWISAPGGRFLGERTLVIEGAGCPGQGPGTHRVPIGLTPIDPPPR